VRLKAAARYSHGIMPAIAFLLRALGLDADAVEAFAVASGPGSFTGVRIGISTVQGLALASGRGCLAVSGLDVLAARMRGAAPCLVSLIDAYRDEVYAGVYDGEGQSLRPSWVGTPGELLATLPEQVACLGDGALRHREEILRLRPRALLPERSLYLAGSLGLLLEPRLAAGEGGPADALRPLYLRAPHIRPASG
jgi:tRNA threonylcarbamoyladenosine biosynthesis protein TsaB